MECNICVVAQTFVPLHDIHQVILTSRSNVMVVRCEFWCSRCNLAFRDFLLVLDKEASTVKKVGQYPAWDIRGDKRVEKLLGNRAAFWRKGLICESQAYGIGAFSYYRRIVELIIDDLIRDLRESIPFEELGQYEAGLEKVEKARQTSEKIAIARELLPQSLRPNGENPLGRLYETLSEGLHSYE